MIDAGDCIRRCTETHLACVEATVHCLATGGSHVEARHLRLLLDCQQVCQQSSDFLLRRSEFHTELCRLCAHICRECAEKCEAFEADTLMQRCAATCRDCAASCDAVVLAS